MPSNRTINMSVLAGQPLDGSGQVCIHLFLRDSKGRIVEPHVLHPVTEGGSPTKQLEARPARGRLACDRKRTVAPKSSKGVIHITPRTDDPRAVTCSACKASTEWHILMDELNKGG